MMAAATRRTHPSDRTGFALKHDCGPGQADTSLPGRARKHTTRSFGQPRNTMVRFARVFAALLSSRWGMGTMLSKRSITWVGVWLGACGGQGAGRGGDSEGETGVI